MKAFRNPCYYAEAVYLLYNFVNHVSYDEDYNRIVQTYGLQISPQNDMLQKRIRELSRIAAKVTEGLDPENERLRFFFERLPGTDRKTGCCLAQVMLVSVPIQCTDVDSFARQLTEDYEAMQAIGIKINDMSPMGLVLEPWDGSGKPDSMASQIQRLPCSVESKWEILRVLTDFGDFVRELTELIRPVARLLEQSMETLVGMNEELLETWSAYFQIHTVDEFQNQMFDSSFLFLEENLPHEIWLGIWNFNAFGVWSEWVVSGPKKVRIAYIGMGISLDLAVDRRVRPDEESLCTTLRALSGKDKLEILRRCAREPCSAAKLATAMQLNSGTVSRNLYGLYKLGYLETRGDGERVNYITRLDNMERIFRWVLDYVAGN